MADNDDVMRCPLCHGHGELRRNQLEEWLSDPDLRGVIDRYRAQLRGPDAGAGKPVPVTEKKNGDRNFKKEVHRWNTQLPIFSRSPKE
jgi:hypothetical protein